MEVENFNGYANQFIITDEFGTYFQSYKSMIAFKRIDGKVFLGNDWDYSTTTGKYRNMFLNDDKKGIIKGIKDGYYILADLDNSVVLNNLKRELEDN